MAKCFIVVTLVKGDSLVAGHRAVFGKTEVDLSTMGNLVAMNCTLGA